MLTTIESSLCEFHANFFIVALFNKICAGCFSYDLIGKLNEIYKNPNSSITVLAYVLDTYDERDLTNLRTHLKVDLPFKRADVHMSGVWRSLIDEFGEAQLNNILFIINANGEVLEVMELDKPELFFSRLSKIVMNKGGEITN